MHQNKRDLRTNKARVDLLFLMRSRDVTTIVNAARMLGTRMISSGFRPAAYLGPSYENVIKIRSENLAPCIKSHFREPLLIHQGRMQWLYDHKGKEYLDLFGGIVTVSVGHCHPKVTTALKDQADTLWHTTNIYMHPKIHEYARALAEKLPGDLKVVYFVNSGSEANDLATMMARLHTGNLDVIVLKNSYHGGGTSTIGLTAQGTWKFPQPVLNVHAVRAQNPDVYKGSFGGNNCRDSQVQPERKCDCPRDRCNAALNYANDVKDILEYCIPKAGPAAFIAESIQGVGGTVQFPKGYLKIIYKYIRERGGICIADEVQTGFGRTGSHFWGFESHGVVPDIVTMAKGIGNGFPLAAVVTTPKISRALTKAHHFNTFGGNPLASAVGLRVLQVIEEEELQKNCARVGDYFLRKLSDLRETFAVVGDVRGKGLMIGVELVEDKTSKSPLSPDKFADIWEDCKNAGVLFGLGGIKGNVSHGFWSWESIALALALALAPRENKVLRVKPPMCITTENVDFAVDVLKEAIKKFT